jgi:shikimate 5-dehydrogenase
MEAGAEVCVYNRTEEKTSIVTSSIGGIPISEQDLFLPNHFDIVVNATSAHFSSPFPRRLASLPFCTWGVRVAAEFAFPSKTPFLEAAEAQGVIGITGKEVWARQAAKQFQWWCDIDEAKAFLFLREELSCRLQW